MQAGGETCQNGVEGRKLHALVPHEDLRVELNKIYIEKKNQLTVTHLQSLHRICIAEDLQL